MKKFLSVFFAFTLYFNLITQASAASLGGWSLGSPVASGASAIVNGTKEIILNGASKIAKGTAKITPNAAQVAKVLRGGVAGYALSVAVEQLLGAVDWVLDPANNQIVYYKEPTTTDPQKNEQYMWKFDGSGVFTDLTLSYGLSAEAVCNAVLGASSNRSPWFYDKVRVSSKSASLIVCYLSSTKTSFNGNITVLRVANPAYDPTAESERDEKSIPLETVAQKVISNAAGGDASAQQAITAAAQDVINEAENDTAKAAPIVQQLEASKAIEAENTATGEQTQNPEKPNVTDISLEFPAFCGWAPTVCEAAQTVISFPITLTSWWNTANQKADSWANSISQSWAEAKEWATSEKNEDTELDIPDQEQPDIDTDIAFGGMCPDDRQAEINMGVGVIKMPISYEPICTTVSTAKPVLIFVGFFVAALIIGGVKTE
ncbi:virulence factor TspB C-terminal domain-related protein [Acinetobacter radioresistens]|uniref:virulence factor TspB C-terminal domain-related protein n=2 Tax=Acinetobacter radioresistens TaxID=40216 RepID=UPI002A5A233E|nr:virulence factor TspB C-terminal domain-related protein [Acinetobacter radioresistens]MDY0842761.1 virulence factor TspB C-terminal domain-related protein [Acinetobacter radioresistens]